MSRPLLPLVSSFLAAAALTAVAPLRANDDRVLEKAGAGGRFEMLIDRPAALPGHDRSIVQEFRDQLDAVIALMLALPAVSQPPPPRCTRLDSWISRDDVRRILSGSVGVQIPELAAGGACAKRSEMSVQLGINQFEPFLPPVHVVSSASAAHDWYVLTPKRTAPGVMELESGAVLLFDPARSPFRPVTSEAYARYQLDQITSAGTHDGGELGSIYRERLAGWSPTERAAPACTPDPAVTPNDLLDMVIDIVPACPEARRVVEINPDYFDMNRPAAIQLISLEYPLRASLESDGSWQLRTAIWMQIDQAAMHALVERTEPIW